MVSNCLACPLQKIGSVEKKNLELSRHSTELVWHATHAHAVLHARLSHAAHARLTEWILKRLSKIARDKEFYRCSCHAGHMCRVCQHELRRHDHRLLGLFGFFDLFRRPILFCIFQRFDSEGHFTKSLD